MEKQDIIKALEELRKEKERKFEQSADLIINLKNFDIKKQSVNLMITLPHKIRENRIGAFLETRSKIIDTITKGEFESYKDKKKLKKLIKEYDFFVSAAKIMPLVASTFGKVLGPAGKMPSPPTGIVMEENEKNINDTINKFEGVIKIKSKEPSLKFAIGKTNMKNEDIAENILHSYNLILNALPGKKENIKSVMIKLTMTKPLKINF